MLEFWQIVGSINDFITDHATSPWVLLIMAGCIIIDAVIPIFPSESLVISLGAIAIATDELSLSLVVLVAAVSAALGDLLAYTIGGMLGKKNLRVLKYKPILSAMDWAERQLHRRAATLLIAARYIPGGRVAVNMMAGALKFPRKPYLVLIAIAGVIWASYSVVIGIVFGSIFGHNPLLAVVLGVVGGVLLGFLVDFVLSRIMQRRIDAGKRPVWLANFPQEEQADSLDGLADGNSSDNCADAASEEKELVNQSAVAEKK